LRGELRVREAEGLSRLSDVSGLDGKRPRRDCLAAQDHATFLDTQDQFVKHVFLHGYSSLTIRRNTFF